MTASKPDTGVICQDGDGGGVRMPGDRERLRQAAIDLATAQLLERRADLSPSAPLALLLRDRARRRRCRAERLRSVARTPT